MAWRNFKVEEQRLQVVQAYMQGNCSMTAICKHYGISRKTGYKWYERYLEEGEEGLKDLSRAPHLPAYCYTENQMERAIHLKLQHRTWGPKKILTKLQEKYPHEKWPSPTRLYEIFKDHDLVTKKRMKGRVPATAPLGDLHHCNDTWAVDLKGWFFTQDGKKCEPLTMTDCFTRYLIRCTHMNKHRMQDVWPIFDEAFREYGLPHRIRSDNGPPFGSRGVGRLSRLSVSLIKAGVIPEWIDPGHPEQNGRHERFHLTLQQEIANPPKKTLSLQIQAMRQFYDEYNFERPHEALGQKTPGSCYQASPRTWDGRLRSPEYDTKEFELRKVEKSGHITWKGLHLFIGETLQGEYIGLRMNEEENMALYYGPIYLGKINQHQDFEKPKIKTRRQR